jgi:SNF2 family DNA or RNA helicase
MTIALFAHQKASINFCRGKNAVFDASDPGTGKTCVAIESFVERRVRGGSCALIITPKSSIKSTWVEDFKKFAPYIRTSCAYAKNRAEAFWKTADVYITNHDATKWLAKQPPEFFDPFDTLIIDEVGAYKHHTSQRSKALNKIKKYFSYRHIMNGTPNPNSITEIWNQMYILDDGHRLGPSFFKFRSTVCIPKQVGPSANMLKWEDRPGANDAVSKLIEDFTIRHKFEDCIDIPPNHEYSVEYLLTPKQMKNYLEMEKAQIALIEGTTVSAVNAAAVATKLLQIASGAVYDTEKNYHLVDTERYSAVIDKAEERKHVVIFFLWKHQKEQLIAEAKKRKMSYCLIDGTVSDTKRNENVTYYQRGMYRICFAHPQSAAHSLTLTRGTAVIWASPTYNLEHYQQGFRRIYRATQENPTETITFVAANTIEEKVWEALGDKKVRMDELLTQITHGREKE